MATSGTIGTTRINTSKLLEKAVRRCGLSPQSLTVETVQSASEDLFMLLLSLSNRGLNLWCIDKLLLPLTSGKATYTLPVGTQSILNLLQSTHTLVTGTDTAAVDNYTVQFAEDNRVVRFGVTFSTLPVGDVLVQTSSDGVTWVTGSTITELPLANQRAWYDVDTSVSAAYFRLYSATFGVVSSLLLSTENREVVVSALNRDDYSSQPNKTYLSDSTSSYFFEKLVDPQVTYWPVPSDENKCMVLYRYRQIQDVGTLTQELEIPARWYEAITWHLAARLAFELPGVEQARRGEVVSMSQSMVIEVEAGETDNGPTFFAPRISVYTR